MDLRRAALAALELNDVSAKLQAVAALADRVRDAQARNDALLCCDRDQELVPSGPLPGRPEKPQLVSPAAVPRRSPASAEGRAALMHAVAHIEFNAISLALDAIWRFPGLPDAYYADWSRVAAEEAHHFQLVAKHLLTLGHAYGDFAAHNGLWEMVEKTSGDVTARMALVPRTLEARGLDATPPIQRKLAQAGDHAAVAILDIILRDEVGHVAIGNQWYRWLCNQQGFDPVAHYAALSRRYRAPQLKGPFNLEARARAGFSKEELALLMSPAQPVDD